MNLANGLGKFGIEALVEFYPQKHQYFPQLLKVIGKPGSADIIHVNSWNGFVFQADVPLVVTEHLLVHDPVLQKHKSIAQKIFHKLIYTHEKKSFKAADAIISVSDYTQKRLKEVFGFDSIRIYNGVNTDIFYPRKPEIHLPAIGEGKIILLYAGNLSKRKGLDLMHAVMKKLGDKFVLVCVSGVPGKKEKYADNIYVTGKIPQNALVDYYNYCDMLFFPSRAEGFSNTVLEAMACAKPVVTHNCSSMPEQIIDKKGGFLCELNNIRAFTDNIKTLADNPSMRKEMGQFNRDRVEKFFTLKKMVLNHIKLYGELLENKK
jgi:glycosyltransferase involved in cell wall biosynthesis